MTKDAFGHAIDFGTQIRVGKRRKDGKYPVSFIFKSTGRRITNLLTQAKLNEEVDKLSQGDEVIGYHRQPPARSTTATEHSASTETGTKSAAQLESEIDEILIKD